MSDFLSYEQQLTDIITTGIAQISTIKPSDWTEKHVVMGKPRPGPLRYDYTPYTKEVIDCFAPDHPARKITVMKGAQIGFSSTVLIPYIGWMIQNNPGNTYLMVGAPDLVDKSVEKLDLMIHGAGLRDYIKPQVQRKRANKSGDTNQKKDFPGGYVFVGSAGNHKAIAQVDLDNILLDDLDQMKKDSKSSGDFVKLIEKRAAARKDTYKFARISTPLLRSTSIIEPLYNDGDRRRYFIECPCCHDPIILKFAVAESEIVNTIDESFNPRGNGGMVWEKNAHGQVIESSVGYVCYKCSGFFTDKNKYRMLNEARWIPTAVTKEIGHYSYKISSLYAPIGMFDWSHAVRDYVACHPENQPRIESEYHVFLNTIEGETYEPLSEAPKANSIQRNCRDYLPGTVPEQLSLKDGNGTIVMLTCAIDMNGIMNDTTQDVRLDYEIRAWSESGPSYSILHGSIGTFQRGRNKSDDDPNRKKWTYEDNKANSVWPELEKVLSGIYQTDTPSKDSPTGFRRMRIQLSGLDCGHFTAYAYAFLDKTSCRVVGLKGDKEHKYLVDGVDAHIFKRGAERAQDYILKVGLIKDRLSSYMTLNWNRGGEAQPTNFMNFPQPNNGLYGFQNYFEHFESECRKQVVNKDGSTSYRWEKVNSAAANHMWDCSVYNIALKDIVVHMYASTLPELKHSQWADYVKHVLG